MLSFIIKRVLKGLLCVWFIWTLVFVLVRVTGDPTGWMLPDGASTAAVKELREEMHLDEPIIKQYVDSFLDLLHGDMGKSYYYKQDVKKIYSERLRNTFSLAVPSFLLAVAMGIGFGIIAALKHNTFVDRALMTITIVGHTIPSFCFGIILIMIFSVTLHWLPTFGTGSFRHMIMPMLTLAWGPMSSIARLTRGSLLDVMTKEYIDGARMKGLSERKVMVKHALRNSLISVVTVMGVQVGHMISGAVVVETVFSWPGMGQMLVNSAKQRDFPTVQYGILLVAFSVTFVNILVDISYGFLNPKIRESFK
ncbi:MAG: ABC transporter permease [Spirochaetales bacterium]|nr:ABC transporter permease [Spirochaetales bacterium]